MTQPQFETRSQRAVRELFVISPGDEGWRVRTASNPSQYYLVSATENGLVCNCPDFQDNVSADPDWKCKHVLAVEDYQAKTSGNGAAAGYEEQERASIQGQAPNRTTVEKTHPSGQMLVRRSLSPDGRIDSISIEFSFDLVGETLASIKTRALTSLKLQTEIVRSFVGSTRPRNNGNGAARSNGVGNANTNNGVPARMLDVGIAQTAYGERAFINFDVQGWRARLFGKDHELIEAIAVAGERLPQEALQKGFMLNLPCRVLTERNGKYINVTQVLPTAQRSSNGSEPF